VGYEWDSTTCSPRSRCVTPWVYWQDDKECNFHTYVALRLLTRIQPNLLQRCPRTRRIYVSNLKQIVHASNSRDTSEQSFEMISSLFSSSFRTHFAFSAITCKRILLSSWNLVHVMGSYFGWNPMKIYRVMIDFSCPILQGKPLHVGGVTIIGVPFWFERNPEKDHGDMTENPTCFKITQSSLWE